MYGKSFESKYEGSMLGAGFHVYAVWDYCITRNRGGLIELNPELLAFVLAKNSPEGLPWAEGMVRAAIDFLCAPDVKSRSKEHEGRRLLKEGEYQYRMVNWKAYDGIKSIEALREYNRVKQAEYRARGKGKPKRTKAQARAREEGAASAHERAIRNGASDEQAMSAAERVLEGDKTA